MIFPLRTDRRLTHLPWVNITLIVLCSVVWLLEITGSFTGQRWVSDLTLNPRDPVWYQFITYQFLHQSWEHIALNMLFLYVFGNSLEDRLGPLGYVCFFLAGGIIAGIGHSLVSDAPVLGASGAVSAVTGGFLALFPRSRVTVVWFLLVIDFFEVPAVALVGMQILLDLAFQLATHYYPQRFPMAQVAYVAHLSGNVFGFVTGIALLATGLLPRERYDFLSLVGRLRRREPLLVPAPAGAEQVAALRGEALAALTRRQTDVAVDVYEDLLTIDPGHVLPRDQQLDLADHAMSSGRYATAARAYELFLQHYPADEFADQAQLTLAMVYARKLDRPDAARPLVESALTKLGDPARRKVAQELLAEIGEL